MIHPKRVFLLLLMVVANYYDFPATRYVALFPLVILTSNAERVSTIINNILYAVGGGGGATGFLSSGEAYHPATDTWSPISPMMSARFSPGVAVVNEVLYAIGGLSDGGPLASVEAFIPPVVSSPSTSSARAWTSEVLL
jgi:hypothetical protein